jgi:hypothetical protein
MGQHWFKTSKISRNKIDIGPSITQKSLCWAEKPTL